MGAVVVEGWPSTSGAVARANSGRKLIAIVYMDMVGYSRLIGLDDEGTFSRLKDLRQSLIDPIVDEYGGRLVQIAGDSMLMTFDSIDGAVNCAIKVQREVPIYEAEHLAERRIRFRVGIDIGDVVTAGTELYGNGVNVAARLQARCAAGGVCVTRSVRDHMRGRSDLAFTELGALRLKNIERPVEAFQVAVLLPEQGPDHRGVRARLGTMHAMLKVTGAAAIVVLCLSPIMGSRSTPRAEAEGLVRQGLAIKCSASPCAHEWLASRALFEQAIAVDPTFGEAYAQATFTYTNFVTSHLTVDRNDDLHAAAKLATEAVALAPDKAITHEARGAVLRQDPDKLDDALSAYLQALSINPDLQSVRGNAGWLLVLLGRPAEGEEYLRTALAKAPHHTYVAAWLNYLGLAELFLHRYGEAAELFRQAIAKQPSGIMATEIEVERGLNLAAALALDNKLDEARTVVETLRSKHPAMSTHNILWNCDCSHAALFAAGLATLRRGATLAGVVDGG